MATYRWKSWAAHRRSIEADEVTFEDGYVVFWRSEPSMIVGRTLVVAISHNDVHDLHIDDSTPEWWT